MKFESIYSFIRYPLVIGLILAVVAGCRKTQSDDESEGTSNVKPVVAVKIAKITSGDAVLSITAFGKTDALRKEKVYAPIAGRITVLNVFEGARVKSGEILAVIRTKESQAAILGAEAMVRSARNAQQKAEAENALALAQSSDKSVNVTAKFKGFVSTRSVSEGELVIENAELMTVLDLSTLDFQADVPLRDVSDVHAGQRSTIRFQSIPDKIFVGEVDAINPQTDFQSQTVRVRLRFISNDESVKSTLRTDMIGTAQIVTGHRQGAMFVPKAALLRNDEENTYSVVTVTKDSLAKSIPVTIGALNDSSAEIMSADLRPGMPVITVGNYALQDSTKVSITDQDRE
jgi:membrane fusion protein, multidrug efflux system